MNSFIVVLTSFLASGVELVEALTIVLAIGITRGWRSSLLGAAVAVAVVSAVIAVLGPVLTNVPLDALRLLVGTLLLVFGLQWLRKAILRAGSHKALRDEIAVFQREVAAAATHRGSRRRDFDPYAFTVCFKGVVLEGLEVAFIVVSFGTAAHRTDLAVLGALAALLVVGTVGVVVHRPLSQVPENTVKLVVGLLLSTFGTFWAAEGLGVPWPGNDAAILALLALFAATVWGYIALVRRSVASRVTVGSLGG